MTQEERNTAVGSIASLGEKFRKGETNPALNETVKEAYRKNQWFIPRYSWAAIEQWGKQLTEENIKKWSDMYPLPSESVDVGVVMAGNIPLVGLHDVLAGYLSGHTLHVKPSSHDEVLMRYAVEELKKAAPSHAHRLETVSSLKDADAVIATGSDNTARYFEYYFRGIPSVIRHSRTSVAVVPADVTEQELSLLADDVMMYWGRGCRSVSRVFFPDGFDMERWVRALEKYAWVADCHYYRNNYDYQRAMYAMNGMQGVYDTGYVLLAREDGLYVPTGVVAYDFYDDLKRVEEFLKTHGENIQCACGRGTGGLVPFGAVQRPSLTDYADGEDVMEFFATLKKK